MAEYKRPGKNYTVYVPDEDSDIQKFFDELKQELMLSPRLVDIARSWLTSHSNHLTDEIKFHKTRILDCERLLRNFENNKPEVLPVNDEFSELKEIAKGICIKDGPGAARGYLTGPDNKQILKRKGYDPVRLLNEIKNEIGGGNE